MSHCDGLNIKNIASDSLIKRKKGSNKLEPFCNKFETNIMQVLHQLHLILFFLLSIQK